MLRATGTLVIPNHAELSWLWTVSELVNGAVYLACLASLVVRYWRGDETLRQQLLWLALALIAMLVALVVWVPSVEAGPLVLILLVIPLVPAAITIAVLRYQLLDTRLVVSRALLYGLLTAGVVGSYLVLVAVRRPPTAAGNRLRQLRAGNAAHRAGFQPVRVRLQRLADRALFGDRADPVRAVSRLGARLGRDRRWAADAAVAARVWADLDAGEGRRTSRHVAGGSGRPRWAGAGEVAAMTRSEADPIRVVLADDHPVVRDGLSALLGSVAGIDVVATAATGRDAVRSAVTLRPDVLVLDVQMPDLDGVSAAREITRDAPAVAVLMLTMFDDEESVFAHPGDPRGRGR